MRFVGPIAMFCAVAHPIVALGQIRSQIPSQPSRQNDEPVFTSGANLVQIVVVVRDANG